MQLDLFPLRLKGPGMADAGTVPHESPISAETERSLNSREQVLW
jgi:hypothetical protein